MQNILETHDMRNRKKNVLKHLIYFSKPTIFDTDTINNILITSRENNTQTGVTGSLICRSDLYFQFLEGPIEAVDETFQKIKHDSRHEKIQIIKEDTTNRRLFASWAMREDPVLTWMWTRKEVEAKTLDSINPEEALHTFERLSREVDQFNT